MAKNKQVKNLKDAIWDNGIDGNSEEVKKLAKKIRKKIDTVVSDEYKIKTPRVLNSLVVSRISPEIEQMVNLSSQSFDDVVKATTQLAGLEISTSMSMEDLAVLAQKQSKTVDEVIGSLTAAEMQAIEDKKSVLYDEMVMLNNKLKLSIKTMLLQNIGGEMSFNQMVTGLKELFPAYENNAYTIVNTSLQRMYKDVLFTKYASVGFTYYKYIGPDDSITRPYCQAHVNKYYTEAEAKAVQAEIQTFYNCRHELVPVTKSEYDANVGS